ncbi:MAG: alpha/beta fold hydrolase [Sulfobacillus sp.]
MPELMVDGRRVTVHGQPGDGLLLLHGAGESADVFSDLLERLPDAFAPDLPGHGQSEGPGLNTVAAYANWVSRLLSTGGWTPQMVGGHSLGGAISLSLALSGPFRPKSLVLIATGGRLRVNGQLLSSLAAGVFPENFRRAYLSPQAPVALLDRMGSTPVAVTYGDFLACDGFDRLDDLTSLQGVPALVLVGTDDQYTPLKYAHALVDAIGAQLLVVEGAGHLLPLEAPQKVAAAIAEFLAQQV